MRARRRRAVNKVNHANTPLVFVELPGNPYCRLSLADSRKSQNQPHRKRLRHVLVPSLLLRNVNVKVIFKVLDVEYRFFCGFFSSRIGRQIADNTAYHEELRGEPRLVD